MLELPKPATAGRPQPDPATAVAVMLITLTALGLALAAVLAVYDWRTPAAVRPLMWSVIGVFFAAVGLIVLGGVVRWVRHGDFK